MMDSLMACNGRGNHLRKKKEAREIQQRVKVLKGLLKHDVTNCIDKMKQFEAKYSPDDDTSVKIDYVKRAIDILDTLDCAHDRYKNLERDLEGIEMLLNVSKPQETDKKIFCS